MSKDTLDELERLQEELLAVEEDTPAEASDQSIDDILNDLELNSLLYDEDEEPEYVEDQETVQIYNTDDTDEDPEELSDAVLESEERPITGLAVAALLLTAAIVGVVIYWLIRFTV